MPLYEYQCKSCENSFEKIVSYSKPVEEIECPDCGEKNARKKLSSFSFGSKSSSGEFTPAPASGGCSTCTAGTCSGCGH